MKKTVSFLKKKVMASNRSAIFLDRDGVLNEDLGYVYKPEDLRICRGVIAGLTALKHAGYILIVITNQSGVARGYFNSEDVDRFNQALSAAIIAGGGPKLDGFYVCPHHPSGSIPSLSITCQCRKPEPGMIVMAQSDWDIDLGSSFMFGDKADDIECAVRAGVRAVQVLGKYPDRHTQALDVVPDFLSAVNVILPLGASQGSF